MTPEQAKKRLMHGKDWDGRDVSGWWISEKLDGCRAYWDGQSLCTKEGNPINIPRISNALPRGMAIDGELWCGRGQLQKARVCTQYGKDCQELQFIAFDAPGVEAEWPERLATAKRAGVAVVSHWKAQSMGALLGQLCDLLEAGAEGVMARLPGTPYKPGRSGVIMKLKPHSLPMFLHHADTEPAYN